MDNLFAKSKKVVIDIFQILVTNRAKIYQSFLFIGSAIDARLDDETYLTQYLKAQTSDYSKLAWSCIYVFFLYSRVIGCELVSDEFSILLDLFNT